MGRNTGEQDAAEPSWRSRGARHTYGFMAHRWAQDGRVCWPELRASLLPARWFYFNGVLQQDAGMTDVSSAAASSLRKLFASAGDNGDRSVMRFHPVSKRGISVE